MGEGMTRSEVGRLTDTALRLRYAAVADKIVADWRRGAPGRLADVFEIALMRLEAEIRSLSLTPISTSGFTPLDGFPSVDANGDLVPQGAPTRSHVEAFD